MIDRGALNMPEEMIYSTASPRIGVVVGTFAAIPYIHLHLENWRRHYPQTPLLINDDGSPYIDELEALCVRYGASLIRNECRLRQTVGDMSAYVNGFDWAQSQGIEILVKLSRRFLPCYDWVAELQALAFRSQMPTFSQTCNHFNFGFRTECIGFHCESWRASGALDAIRGHVTRNEPVFVEGFIHQLARKTATDYSSSAAKDYMRQNPRPPDRDGYAVWSIMPDRRTTRIPQLLWHDCDGPFDYCRAAAIYGLSYTAKEFEDANQGCGQGEP